jgi:chitinase
VRPPTTALRRSALGAARYAFWSVNRDRSCASGGAGDACSGVSQSPYAYTKIVAQYAG